MTTLEFGLLCGLICVLMVDILYLLGIYTNRKGRVALVTRFGYYIKTTDATNFYYLPIIYRIYKYKLKNNVYKIKINKEKIKIKYDIINVKLFHYNKKKLHEYILKNDEAYKIGIRII